MNHHHLEASALCQRSAFPVSFNDIVDLFFCERFHRNAIRTRAIAWPILTETRFFIFVNKVGASVLSGVRQFHAWHGTMTLDAIGKIGEARQ